MGLCLSGLYKKKKKCRLQKLNAAQLNLDLMARWGKMCVLTLLL